MILVKTYLILVFLFLLCIVEGELENTFVRRDIPGIIQNLSDNFHKVIRLELLENGAKVEDKVQLLNDHTQSLLKVEKTLIRKSFI